MTKQRQTAFLKDILNSAATLKEVMRQETEMLTRLEDQAKAELEALGSAPVRARKGIVELPPEQIFKLRASLTTPGNRKIKISNT